MLETVSNAKPSEVGGILRRIMGAREAEQRINRVKFKHERRRFGKEHELLSLVEAIFGLIESNQSMLKNLCFEERKRFDII